MESPSIFELIQEDSLRQTFRRAIRHFVKFTINRFPSFPKLSNIFDNPHLNRLKRCLGEVEVILIIEALVEWSFLYKYNSTFTEKFLSLQRFDRRNNGQLVRKQILLSVVSLAIFPYLIKKLDQYNDFLEEKAFTLNPGAIQADNGLGAREKDFLLYYGHAKKLYDFIKIISWLSYASSSSSYPNPLMATLLRSVRIGYKDDEALESALVSSWIGDRLASTISSTFSLAFKTSAFMVQFIDYWLSQADVRQMLSFRGFAVDMPAPFRIKNIDRNRDEEKEDSSSQCSTSSMEGLCSPSGVSSLSPNLCPLCFRLRRNATALSCSGYIFCYACITGFVTEHGKCPISDFPASLSQLIRIYD